LWYLALNDSLPDTSTGHPLRTVPSSMDTAVATWLVIPWLPPIAPATKIVRDAASITGVEMMPSVGIPPFAGFAADAGAAAGVPMLRVQPSRPWSRPARRRHCWWLTAMNTPFPAGPFST
jgi:hypothetical protein